MRPAIDRDTSEVNLKSTIHHRPTRVLRGATPYVFIAPATLLVLGIIFYPLAHSLVNSFQVDDLLYPQLHQFVGVRNYASVLTDPHFLQSAGNSVVYWILTSIGALIGGLVIALWLHSITRFRGLWLAIVILPWAVPGTVAGVLWTFIYNPSGGLLNAILRTLGLISHNVVWLNGSLGSLVFVTIMLVWQITPIVSVIFLAGIESIPPSLYEAALVDGSSAMPSFFKVTLPLLRPALAIGLVEAGILGIGVFDQVYVLTGYDPGTKSVVIQTYLYAFQNLNFGEGIASSLIITVTTLLLSLVYLRFLYREVSFA